MHAGGDGLRAQQRRWRCRAGRRNVEQRRAAQDGAGGLAELVAGQRGAVQFLVGGAQVHPLDLHRRAAPSEGKGEEEAGWQTGLAAESRRRFRQQGHAGDRAIVVIYSPPRSTFWALSSSTHDWGDLKRFRTPWPH